MGRNKDTSSHEKIKVHSQLEESWFFFYLLSFFLISVVLLEVEYFILLLMLISCLCGIPSLLRTFFSTSIFILAVFSQCFHLTLRLKSAILKAKLFCSVY